MERLVFIFLNNGYQYYLFMKFRLAGMQHSLGNERYGCLTKRS